MKCFKKLLKLFIEKWSNKPDLDEAIKNYFETFNEVYLQSSINGWYDGKASGFPVTNNALESHNDKLKDLCQRASLSLSEFLNALDTKVFDFWSFQRSDIRPDSKLYSHEPNVSISEYIRAFHWIQLNLKVQKLSIGDEKYYFVVRTPKPKNTTQENISTTQTPHSQLLDTKQVATQSTYSQTHKQQKKRGRKPKNQLDLVLESQPIVIATAQSHQHDQLLNKLKCKKFLTMLKNCNWDSFDEFLSSFQQLRIIKLNEENWKLSTCTCPSWFKHYMCKHIIGISYYQGLFDEFPIEACEIALGKSRPPGRPKTQLGFIR